ncbi:hypothetical protein WJX84_003709 [Apatococcus fuscideae]|uniref:Uncharacterized protein n=1 Tax=Apatococcus fuscideae TaxID=2026836 RepID=A0AAW1TGU1_9CHLO
MFVAVHLAVRRAKRKSSRKVLTDRAPNSKAVSTAAGGFYVESGSDITSEPLHTQLKIPELQLKEGAASDNNLPEDLCLASLGFLDEADSLLQKAAHGYDQAITAAGISTDGSQDVVEGMKAVLPSFRLLGPTLENHHARYGIQHMQDVERLLQQFGQALETIANSLMGLVVMAPPQQPLAMTELLQALTSGSVHLDTCCHPVIKALYHVELEDEADELAEMSDQAASRPHRVRTFVCSSVGGALGKHQPHDDRALAKEIAGDVCMADLLEFQRLTEQFEELRRWLLC